MILCVISYEKAYVIREILLQQAGVYVQHLVEKAGDVESQGSAVALGRVGGFAPSSCREGVFELVSVVKYLVRTADGAHRVAGDASDAFEGVAHLALFGFELHEIVEHLPFTSAADAEMGAFHGHAQIRIFLYRDGLALAEGLLAFQQLQVHYVAWRHKRYEDDLAVYMGQRLPFGCHLFNTYILHYRLFFAFSAHRCWICYKNKKRGVVPQSLQFFIPAGQIKSTYRFRWLEHRLSLVGDREFFSAFSTASGQNFPAVGGGHSLTKSVLISSFSA